MSLDEIMPTDLLCRWTLGNEKEGRRGKWIQQTFPWPVKMEGLIWWSPSSYIRSYMNKRRNASWENHWTSIIVIVGHRFGICLKRFNLLMSLVSTDYIKPVYSEHVNAHLIQTKYKYPQLLSFVYFSFDLKGDVFAGVYGQVNVCKWNRQMKIRSLALLKRFRKDEQKIPNVFWIHICRL